MRDCYDRLRDAENVLREIKIAKEKLGQEWESQVAYHTRPLPSKPAYHNVLVR